MYAALNTSGLLLLRGALRDRSEHFDFITTISHPRVLAGLVLYGLGFLAWIVTLRRYQLSFVYPLFIAVSYVSVAATSVVLLGEHVTWGRAVGIGLIGVGVLFVVR
jgi:drug/metabolite transporter (DMT)-like permease